MSESAIPLLVAVDARRDDRRLWLGYAGLCLLCWLLYAAAGTDWLRGAWRFWEAAYEATWNLLPPMLLGTLVLPWMRWLQARAWAMPARLALHAPAALLFAALWHAVDFALAAWLFGADHAAATFEQRVVWRSAWGVLVYTALVYGFGGVLHARRAHRAALAAAQAEAALVRAELAAISGKLNPHFLFNTLNSIIVLTRKDARAAERALLSFSRMLRYLLDTNRGGAERVRLQEELDFVRDYLELESMRLGSRLGVVWSLDEDTGDDRIPPLTLQPLVENAIVHGIAPRTEPGTVHIECRRLAEPERLLLRVSDDGAGCVWPPAEPRRSAAGIGLSALRRRFELDYDGRAAFDVRSSPGAGFRIEIVIPRTPLAA
ncbi:MAG TPA: histidine kinase [Caldimonas sp.]|jgi:signal transduction histidine kinase|nr:histidine kinase [Caldimonas sp.]HEX2539675.1 histidine kinase [Caldimonas sp.]